MALTVLYFASLREAVGIAREQIDLPPDVATAGELRVWLRQREGVWAQALAEGRAVRVAVDQRMGGADTPVADGAEVAFFPPVTGG
jgi:molybdopterin synthase sulfur carrier subunit